MLGPMAMLGAAADEAIVESPPAPGPTGPPTNASTFETSGPATGIQWTNGDATANTGYGKSNSPSVDPTSQFGSVSPGTTSVDTGDSVLNKQWFVRHQKNGQNTVWVHAGESFGSGGE